jgi:hypothetical protein
VVREKQKIKNRSWKLEQKIKAQAKAKSKNK